ncbi:MAG: BrnT family toxin [Rubrobacteraceae bacterium]
MNGNEGNEGHIARHGIEVFEVEEALEDPGWFGVQAYDVPGESRRAMVGATSAGRILFVVYTMRGDKVRPITARDADDNDKRRYRARR